MAKKLPTFKEGMRVKIIKEGDAHFGLCGRVYNTTTRYCTISLIDTRKDYKRSELSPIMFDDVGLDDMKVDDIIEKAIDANPGESNIIKAKVLHITDTMYVISKRGQEKGGIDCLCIPRELFISQAVKGHRKISAESRIGDVLAKMLAGDKYMIEGISDNRQSAPEIIVGNEYARKGYNSTIKVAGITDKLVFYVSCGDYKYIENMISGDENDSISTQCMPIAEFKRIAMLPTDKTFISADAYNNRLHDLGL